ERSTNIGSTLREDAIVEEEVVGMYYEDEEHDYKMVPHQTLAMSRARKEKELRNSVAFQVELIISQIEITSAKRKDVDSREVVKEAIADAFKRLIGPSVEREIRTTLTEKAEEQAIHVFSENLKSLLLQPPLRGKVVLGVDPAFRSGCKLAVVDETGKLQEVSVIYPHALKGQKEDASKTARAQKAVLDLLKKYPISIIAIGNGTASRETERFIANCLKESASSVSYVIVN